MLQEIHHILFTPSVFLLPFYSPSIIGFCATSGLFFLLLLVLRWLVPPLRRVILPAANRETTVLMLVASGILVVSILFWGSPTERWDLDLLWDAGYWALIFALMHFMAQRLSKRSA